MNTCAFCGPTEADITKEHVWPVWVPDALKPVMIGDTVYHQRFDHDVVVKEWAAGQINLQVRILCKPCNRDRLGGFEGSSVKPLLVKAISQGTSATFTLIEQATIAAWACKMAMVYEFANPGKPTFFTAEDRKAFRDSTRALPELEIRLARYAFTERRFGHCYSALHEMTENFRDCRTLQLFLTTMVVGYLIMQLIAVRDKATGTLLPASSVEVEYSQGALDSLEQVWPIRKRSIVWPPRNTVDEHELLELSTMWEGPSRTRPPGSGG